MKKKGNVNVRSSRKQILRSDLEEVIQKEKTAAVQLKSCNLDSLTRYDLLFILLEASLDNRTVTSTFRYFSSGDVCFISTKSLNTKEFIFIRDYFLFQGKKNGYRFYEKAVCTPQELCLSVDIPLRKKNIRARKLAKLMK